MLCIPIYCSDALYISYLVKPEQKRYTSQAFKQMRRKDRHGIAELAPALLSRQYQPDVLLEYIF